jgi:hypothetical protein
MDGWREIGGTVSKTSSAQTEQILEITGGLKRSLEGLLNQSPRLAKTPGVKE